MTNVLVVLGSAREGRVSAAVAEYVTEEITKREGFTATVADLKAIDMPFFDNPRTPSDPEYEITNENVKNWQKLVQDHDAVLFLTPEYNHGVSPIQKNAIDSLFADWEGKKVSLVAYNWGTTFAVDQLTETLTFLKTDFKSEITHLAFMQQIGVDGSLVDEDATRAQINKTLDAIA